MLSDSECYGNVFVEKNDKENYWIAQIRLY